VHTGLWWRDLAETDHLEDTGVDWKKIFKSILKEVGWEGMDWIDLAQERDRWWALLNLVGNLRVPQNVGNFFSS
jgi:hypothetical protein